MSPLGNEDARAQEEGMSMPITILLLSILIGFGVCRIVGKNSTELLRQRAGKAVMASIRDATRPVKLPVHIKDGSVLQMFNAEVFYSDVPLLTVNEWSEGGQIDGPSSASRLQWSCYPGYELKFDGDIPYCEAFTRKK